MIPSWLLDTKLQRPAPGRPHLLESRNMRPLTRFAATVAAGLLGLTALSLTTPVADRGADRQHHRLRAGRRARPGHRYLQLHHHLAERRDVRPLQHAPGRSPAGRDHRCDPGRRYGAGRSDQPAVRRLTSRCKRDLLRSTACSPEPTPSRSRCTVSAAGSADTSSTATLSWTDGGGAQTLTSLPVTDADQSARPGRDPHPGHGGGPGRLPRHRGRISICSWTWRTTVTAPRGRRSTITLPVGMTLGTSGVVRDTDGSNLTCVNGPGSSVQLRPRPGGGRFG